MTSTQFLELAISLSVQVALVIIVAHWLGRLVNSEQMQCRLWTICYVVLLSLIGVALLLPHPRLFQPWVSIGAQHTTTLVTIEMQLGQILFFVWLAGASVSLMVFFFRSFQVNRFLNTCQPLDLDEFVSEENQLDIPELTSFPSKQRLRLLTSTRLTTPFCSQFHYPYIVVPEYLLGFDRQKLNFIIRHELEHLKTGHPLQLFLQRVVEVIFWFHPMVWWASQQSSISREFACDEAAIDSPSDIVMYLQTLLTIMEYSASQAEETPTSLAFGRGKSIVAKRARRLTQIAKRKEIDRRSRILGPAACFSLVMLATLIGFLWLPIDVLASSRTNWSPWPTWSAGVLHDFDIPARDFEVFDPRIELHELLEHQTPESIDDD
ncbi:M56 family metallopeptidase [Gimesia algae]|uniref:Regulatory protein BlaR1 n=1 Tax=Gimesia algae TaxID=2527971 RepID=A0A517VER6_9PLAN|nr:M56 family metallopeptidase [Gimesia algae]QDT91490.1 Regulatory protein BlaR1 [Gimesia algae]